MWIFYRNNKYINKLLRSVSRNYRLLTKASFTPQCLTHQLNHRKTFMHPVILKTLGGLSKQYYFRQLFFGLAIGAFSFFTFSQNGLSMPSFILFLTVINTLLYPYSRFAYESSVGFVMGENVFFVNSLLMLATKAITMVMCWGFAIFVAPFAFTYLYYKHSKAER